MSIKKWFRASLNCKHIITIIAAIAFLVAAIVLFSNNSYSYAKSSKFLSSRDCNYSIIIDKELERDTYAFYGRSISFSESENLKKTVNAIVLMEIGNTHSDNDLFSGYDVSSLKENEIAISNNLARYYNLYIGSTLFSRSKYNDSIITYTISLIFPDLYGIDENATNIEMGIIVAGKSKDYLDNIKSDFIYFYNEDYSLINQSGAIITGNLNSIRTARINITKNHFLYSFATFIMISIIASLFFVLMVAYNNGVYVRKKEIGFVKLKAYIAFDIAVYYFVTTFFSTIIYLSFFLLISISIEFLLMLICTMTISAVLAYFIESWYLKGR